MKELLRLLSVRILNAANEPIGSGFLYIHDQENVFVLTAAHVINDLTDDNTFWAECQPERGCKGTDIRCFQMKRSNVYSDYQAGTAPKDEWIFNDVAVIRLQDIEDQEWLKRRMCEVRFAQNNAKLEEYRFMGFGYPGYTAKDKVYLAEVEFKPEYAVCEKYVPEEQKTKWELGLKVANAKNKKEYEGFSGSILAIAGLKEVVLGGIVQCVYKEFAGNEVLGADMTHIQWLLEDQDKGAGITVHKAGNLKPEATENTPVQSAMPPVSDFNLRCVRNMLEGAPEGQSWAHKLRESKGLNVSFEQEVGQPMRLDGFVDDAAFLKAILPEKIYKILFDVGEDAASVAAVMDGTYPAEKKRKIKECLPCGHTTPIDAIINNCDKLMDAGDWERCFKASHQAFFSLMGEAVRYLEYQMKQCETYQNMEIGMAMFIVYALLGDAYYKAMTNKQSVTDIFKCMKS